MDKQERKARSTTMSEPIYEALKEDIIVGKLSGGEPLRQDDIARDHGVSKIPVREALLKLEADGFVLFRKNRGATVRELSMPEILNLLDIRVALECKALELAIPNQIKSDHVEARKILDEYSSKNNPEFWSEMNRNFHHTLYEPCANPQLLDMILGLQRRIGPVVRLLVTETSGLERPSAEHHEILEACEKGNAEVGVELLRQHIETTKKETAARLRRIDTFA